MVQTWDAWMERATGIPEAAACGQPIDTLFPDLSERGHLERLRRVAAASSVEILAPALHRYLLPCTPVDPASPFERMRQHVVIAPIHDTGGAAGVSVTIEDVTARFERERQAAALDSHIEAVRLGAVKDLARDASGTALLSDALADDSWRVRRVAAEGLAQSDERAVIGTLLDAVREHHRNPALLNAALTALGHTRQDVVFDVAALLAASDPDVRTYAALALGLVGDARGTMDLLATLADDTEQNVRFHAIEALGRIGDLRAVDALTSLASHDDFFLSFPAVDALAAIGDASAAPSLIPLLANPDLAPSAATCLGAIGAEDVVVPLVEAIAADASLAGPCSSAITAIANRYATDTGDRATVPGLVRGSATGTVASAVIGALDGATNDDLRGLLTVASWLPHEGIDEALARQLRRDDARRLAAELLAGRGVRAAPFVEAIADDADADVRCAVAGALGGIGSASSVPTLLAMLDGDPDPALTIAVASALGSIGDTRPFDALFARFDHPDAAVRQSVVAALSSIPGPDMEARVKAALGDSSPRIRECAARVAGYFTYASCLPLVIERAVDPDPLVRRAAVESLGIYDDPDAATAVRNALQSDADGSVRAAATRALSQGTSSAVSDLLREALGDPNLWVRYYAARASGRLHEPTAELVNALAERVAQDRAAPVRVAAIEAIATLGQVTILAPLLLAATDLDDDVSAAALRALAAYPEAESIDTLARAVASGSPRQRGAALEALGSRGAEASHALPAVIRVASDPRDSVNSAAVATLGQIGGPSAIAALLSIGGRHAARADVVRALGSGGGVRVAELAAALTAATDADRALLVAALGRVRGGRVREIVAQTLDDPSPTVRRISAWMLLRVDERATRMRPDGAGR